MTAKMMSKKQWTALLCLHVTYLFLGASIFYHIENPLETKKILEERRERIEVQRLIYTNYMPDEPDAQMDLLNKLEELCGQPMTQNITMDEPAVPIWDFYHSFFFSYTVISTIGYGNLAPTTSLGRIIMIFYACFGVPMNAILFANLGQFFSSTFRRLYRKYKAKNPASGSNIDYLMNRFGMVGQIAMYLIPGLLFFIFMPACFFVIFEGWDYVLAVYYAFVTLTTIGFGDYVAAVQDRGFGVYFQIYKALLIFWITFGLGYIGMVIGFMTQGLRSKKVLELEHRLAKNLKETHSRIWNGVTKDVSYLRKILNEIYMMRFKPVYRDEVPPMRTHRSSSCPSLSFEKTESPQVARRRANSEAFILHQPKEMQRVQSDSDLLAIDRNKTFEPKSRVQPAELLARVVDALGSIHSEDDNFPEDEGFHGFSDDEILASERTGSGWSIGGDRMYANPPKKQRTRAISEIKVPVSLTDDKIYNSNEFTWCNTTSTQKIKDHLSRCRKTGKLSMPNVPTYSRQSMPDSDGSSSPRNILSKLNPFKRKDSKAIDVEKNRIMPRSEEGMTPTEYLKKTARGRASMAPISSRADEGMTPAEYLKKTARGRASMAPISSRADGGMTPAEYLKKTARGRASMVPISSRTDGGMTPAEYLKKTARGRASMVPISPHQRYLNSTRDGRPSRISLTNENADLLEQTTIADLIRALEALHSGANPDYHEAPRRKLGTASLTPPKSTGINPLMMLFSPERPPSGRRFSVHTTVTPPSEKKHSSAGFPPAVVRRRFSVHPAISSGNIFTPTLTPLISGTVSDDSRGSTLPPPYTPVEYAKKRPTGGPSRRFSLWGSSPNPRPHHSHFPSSIFESSRTRHGSLNMDLDKPHNSDS